VQTDGYLQPQFFVLVFSALLLPRDDLPISKTCLFYLSFEGPLIDVLLS